jgi:hypothetical protein
MADSRLHHAGNKDVFGFDGGRRAGWLDDYVMTTGLIMHVHIHHALG